jgi:NADH-quinone oxidoreductase subunit N
VTLALVIVVALAAGLASTLLGPRLPRAAAWVGLAGALAALGLALALGEGDGSSTAPLELTTSVTVRLVAVGWAASTLLLGVVGRVTGGAATTVGPSLIALGASSLALASDEPGLAFACLAVGGLAVVVAPTLGSWLADRDEAPLTTVAVRGAGATVGAGVVGLLAAAWSHSPVGPFGAGIFAGVNDPSFRFAVGLALLAMVAAVVVRSGAIPAHLWAARFVGGVTPLAIPASLAWGSASFSLVALGWSGSAAAAGSATVDDVGRALVVLVALASVILGGLAAMLHDDLEHVLGYTIVQAAGITLLAFAALAPAANRAATDWLIATAAVTSAMAAWIALARWTYGAHRVSELRGWARRSPALAIAGAAILVGLVGVPGMAVFNARVTLATSVLPGPLGAALAILALSPVLAVGRILVAGVGRTAPEVAAAPRERLGVLVWPAGGWSRGGLSRGGLTWGIRSARALVGSNSAFVATVAAVLLAVVGLAYAVIGAGAAA